MVDMIDIHDLPEEQANLVQEFVEFLKRKLKVRPVDKEKAEEEIPLVKPELLLKYVGSISVGGDAVKEAEYYDE